MYTPRAARQVESEVTFDDIRGEADVPTDDEFELDPPSLDTEDPPQPQIQQTPKLAVAFVLTAGLVALGTVLIIGAIGLLVIGGPSIDVGTASLSMP